MVETIGELKRAGVANTNPPTLYYMKGHPNILKEVAWVKRVTAYSYLESCTGTKASAIT